jgi:hypothetical protein
MGFVGDVAKALLISWVVFWISAMIWFTATRQTDIALLFLAGLLIPLSMIAYEYRKYRKR